MDIPAAFKRKGSQISENFLPKKSKLRYNEEYVKFLNWLTEENVMPHDVSDEIFLDYLSSMSKTNKSSTLWTKYSMIKSCLKLKQNIDASNFLNTLAFLKRQSVGYQAKKFSVLTADEVTKFMINAPDKEWLLTKVVLVLGVYGACRMYDLINLKVDNVKDNDDYITVFLKDDKTHSNRIFTLTDEDCPFSPCQIIRKYASLRPSNTKNDRFFVWYRLGRCYAQVVGKNRFATMPMKIAQFLGIKNPENYTGHALRRTSAPMLVHGGADPLTIKSLGKSSKVAKDYIEESLAKKVEASKNIFKTVNNLLCARKQKGSLLFTQPENLDTSTKKNNDNYFTIDNVFENNSEYENKKNLNKERHQTMDRNEYNGSLSCCALECRNTSDSWLMTVFPQDPDLRQQWIDKIGRDSWMPDENCALCEIHFEDDMWEQDIGGEKLLKPDAVPSLFFHTENQSSIDEENSLFKAGTSHQSMEHAIDIEEHSVFIKQEPLDADETEGDRIPSESDRLEGLFETVYCNNENIGSTIIKKELEEQEVSCSGNEYENIVRPNWKCLVSGCQEMFDTKEKMYFHVKKSHKNSEEALELKKKDTSIEKKSQKVMREPLQTNIAHSVPASGIIPKPKASPVIPTSSSQSSVKSSINDPSESKQFLLLIPQQSEKVALKAQNTKPPQSLAPPPPPQPPSSSEWPNVDDSEIFSISLARFSKEKRIAIKKKIIEFVDAVEKRDLDPENVIMALCKKA